MARNSRLLVLAVIAFSGLAHSAEKGAANVGSAESNLETFGDGTRLSWLCQTYELPAAAVVIVEHGKLRRATCGLADQSGRAVTLDSVFSIASLSKVFTALAVADLVSRDQLTLDGDLRQTHGWLEKLAPGDQPVTLRQLLTHTSGFDDRLIGMFKTADEIEPLADYLRSQLPPRTTKPGRWTRYSNHAFSLAGVVVEGATGKTFPDAMTDLVLKPLNMKSTSFVEPLPRELSERRVYAFPCADAKCEPVPISYRHTSPAGAMVTTAADMGAFLSELLAEENPDLGRARRLVFQRHWAYLEDLPGMGLALYEQSIAGYRALVHAGGSSGYRSLLVLIPEIQSGVFFVTSGGSARAGASVLKMFEELLESMPEQSSVAPRPLSVKEQAEYTGTYELARAPQHSYESFPARFLFAHSISADADGYLTRAEGGTVRHYGRIGVGGDLFQSIDGIGRMAFKRDVKSGDVTSLNAADEFFGIRFPGSYKRLSAWETPGFLNEFLSWLLALPVIVILLWSIVELVSIFRRRKSIKSHSVSRGVFAWGVISLTAVAAVADLVFGFGFIARLNAMASGSPEELAFGLPDGLAGLLWLPWLIAALGFSLLLASVVSWFQSRRMRLHDRVMLSVVSLCVIGFVLILIQFQMLPPTA